MERVTDRYADLRREYALGGLAEDDLAPDLLRDVLVRPRLL